VGRAPAGTLRHPLVLTCKELGLIRLRLSTVAVSAVVHMGAAQAAAAGPVPGAVLAALRRTPHGVLRATPRWGGACRRGYRCSPVGSYVASAPDLAKATPPRSPRRTACSDSAESSRPPSGSADGAHRMTCTRFWARFVVLANSNRDIIGIRPWESVDPGASRMAKIAIRVVPNVTDMPQTAVAFCTAKGLPMTCHVGILSEGVMRSLACGDAATLMPSMD